jgi:hypothetical protein
MRRMVSGSRRGKERTAGRAACAAVAGGAAMADGTGTGATTAAGSGVGRAASAVLASHAGLAQQAIAAFIPGALQHGMASAAWQVVERATPVAARPIDATTAARVRSQRWVTRFMPHRSANVMPCVDIAVIVRPMGPVTRNGGAQDAEDAR